MKAREFAGTRDAEMMDRALEAFIERMRAEHELRILAEFPYGDDPNLAMGIAPPMPDLPYDGEIPPDVLELAKRRRAAKR